MPVDPPEFSQNHLAHQIINSVQEGIIVLDSELRYVVWNPFMERLSGVPAKDVIGRAQDLGLLVISAGEHTLRLLPPLVATRQDLERGLKLLEQAIG